MARKTIEIEALKAKINSRLASKELSQETKKELSNFLSYMLHETGNYRGFNYIHWMNGGAAAWRAAGEPEDKSLFLGNEYDREYF